MKDIYQRVKEMLEGNKELREIKNGKRLIFNYWFQQGYVQGSGDNAMIVFKDFMKATAPTSILRARRKVFKDHLHLRGLDYIHKDKYQKEWKRSLGYKD